MAPRIAFISELPLRRSGGGTYAVNWHAHQQLKKRFSVRAAEPILQRAAFWPQFVSRVQRRILHRPGAFAFFSPRRLRENAEEIAARLRVEDEAVFFKSATPWIAWQADRPYFVYLDVCFHTFFHNTFQESDFQAGDLQRIWDAEAAWLDHADAVFWESNWGMAMARKACGVSGTRWMAAGRGGNLEPPASDQWDGRSHALVTIANRFRQKGGDLVLQAFRQLKPKYPDLTWHIIGGPPEGNWRSVGGISYEGFLHPDNPDQAARLRRILEQAFLLVHPTREDTNPLVLTEAAYFGCPAVSVRRFAIPELVQDGETGVLLDFPPAPALLAQAIEALIEGEQTYHIMRLKARAAALENSCWDRIGERMARVISPLLEPS